MQLEIITPDKNVFSGDSNSMVLPASDGLLGILENHAPLIATLAKGTINVRTSEGEKHFEVNGGVVEVLNNKVLILAE